MAELGCMLASAILNVVYRKISSAIEDQIKLQQDFGDDLEGMKMTLESVAALLSDAERRSTEEKSVRLWLKRLKDAMYGIDDMMDEFEAGTKPSASKLVAMIPCLAIGPKIKLANKMKTMRANLEEITKQHRDFSFTAGGGSNIEQMTDTRETSSAVEEALIVGRRKEKQKIVACFSENRTEELTILPIYGFGGMGKTTLAKLVFSDSQFNEYSRVWVYVSHVFDLKKIGNSIISQLSNGDSYITQKQLINRRLQELLAGKKILVVLDDMWRDNDNECQVEAVRAMLRVGEGSKLVVLVTTRDEGLAEELGTIEPHKLAPLTNDMCWTIIKQRSAFESKEGKKQLEQIGRDIARKCGGVALAAQSLGYMLRSMSYDEWKSVRDSDIWDVSASSGCTLSAQHKVLASLRLSYNSMQPYLKLCFGYCATFPKGYEIAKGSLIHQWISLGFIEPSSVLSTRQLSEKYVRQLLGLSFLQVSKSPSMLRLHSEDGVTFTMHDLVHDLARSIMIHEVLDATKSKRCSSGATTYCRYVLLNDCSKPLGLSTTSPGKIRAMHFLDCCRIELRGAAFSSAKALRVLDLRDCSIMKLPDSIGQLKQLRYLNAPRISNQNLPSSITKLSKLMYLNLSGSMMSSLPESIGEIRGLVHLDISDCVLIKTLPESFVNLKKLAHLDMLNCCQLRGVSKALVGLTSIQFLNLSLRADLENILPLEGMPQVIYDLAELRYLGLSWAMHSIFGHNASHETLSFIDRICTLSNLEHLDLSCNHSIVNVPECIGNLRKLHTLNLLNCARLVRLPECIVRMDSLKILNVTGCSELDNSTLPPSKNFALLPHFVVHADDGESSSNITLLRQAIPNELHISSLDNVKSAEEVQAIKLVEKHGLYVLNIEWTRDARRSVDDVEVLGELVPPSTLCTFNMKGYSSVSFPAWFMGIKLYLPHLMQIELDFCKCISLPPLGQLGNLHELTLGGMENVTAIEQGFCGGAGAFPRLKKFCLRSMENLEVWNTMHYGNGSAKDFMFPNLVELSICDCPKLRMKPCPPRAKRWEIDNSDTVLSSWGDGEACASSSAVLTEMTLTVKSSKVPLDHWRLLHHLPAITELTTICCVDLACNHPDIIRGLSSIRSLWLKDNAQTELPKWLGGLIYLRELLITEWKGLSELLESMRHLASLQALSLYGCPSIATLPEWLGDLSALKELVISDCRGIKSLPNSILKLNKLLELNVYDCPELVEWCELEENKKKLVHIIKKDISIR